MSPRSTSNGMNLLPEKARAQVAARRRSRMVLVGALLLIAAALLSFLALAPALFMVWEEQKDKEPASLELQSEQSRKDREEALQTQSLLQALSPAAVEVASVSDIVKEALALRSQDVRIRAISFMGGGKRKLIISGISASRDGLNVYRTALVNSDVFRRVSIPVDALVGASSGIFSITLDEF